MAIRCDDCHYLFSKKRSSCPFCGGRVYRDDNTDATLLAAGFAFAPQGRQQEQHSDPIQSLRQAYYREQQQPTPPDARPTPPPIFTPKPEADQDNLDFFAQFQAPEHSTPIPTVATTYQPTHQENSRRRQQNPYEAERQALERERRRLDRQARRAAFWDRVAGLHWGTIGRVVVIIAVVLAALAIWSMRYVILDSVLSFLIALMPILLIIGGIVWVIRKIL